MLFSRGLCVSPDSRDYLSPLSLNFDEVETSSETRGLFYEHNFDGISLIFFYTYDTIYSLSVEIVRKI